MKNIFDISKFLSSKNEIINEIIDNSSVRIEQIISTGQSSDIDFWYNQDESEWVIVLQGSGIIEYSNHSTITLNVGDSLLIPAHTIHRIQKTANPTIWLAVFFKS